MSPAQTLEQWLRAAEAFVHARTLDVVVDLGCGTGRFTLPLAQRFGAFTLGIDASRRMISTAASKEPPGVQFVAAKAESLPLRAETADLVFASMVWHHLQDKVGCAREIRRILKPDGIFLLRTPTAETVPSTLYLRFFPRALDFNRQWFARRADLRAQLEGSGLAFCGYTCVRQVIADTLSAYAERISLRGVSDLARIPDDEFQEGLDRLRAFCAETGAAPAQSDQPVTEEIDLFAFRPA